MITLKDLAASTAIFNKYYFNNQEFTVERIKIPVTLSRRDKKAQCLVFRFENPVNISQEDWRLLNMMGWTMHQYEKLWYAVME